MKLCYILLAITSVAYIEAVALSEVYSTTTTSTYAMTITTSVSNQFENTLENAPSQIAVLENVVPGHAERNENKEFLGCKFFNYISSSASESPESPNSKDLLVDPVSFSHRVKCCQMKRTNTLKREGDSRDYVTTSGCCQSTAKAATSTTPSTNKESSSSIGAAAKMGIAFGGIQLLALYMF